jgi:hypothetical protein
MTKLRLISLCVILGLLLASGTVQAQRPGCGTARFSNEVLSRFPRAPEACLDVISRDGQQYAVFKAELTRITGNTLHLRFKLPDGSQGPRTTINTQRDFRVLVDGKPTRVRDLAPNQELTAYVHVTEPRVALAPAVETETLYVVPLVIPVSDAPVAARRPEMPETASPVRLMGVMGMMLLVTALSLMLIRRDGDGGHGDLQA